MTALLSSSSRAPLDNDDVEPLGLSLLELEEEETTDHVLGDLTITLRGYPRSSGQTLQCTGETTWRGGDLLARHLWRRRATTATAQREPSVPVNNTNLTYPWHYLPMG